MLHIKKLAKEDWELILERICLLFFTRHCPFCGEVMELDTTQDCPACREARQMLELRDACLDPSTHYWGRLQGAAAVYRYKGCVKDGIHRVKYQAWIKPIREMGNVMSKNLFGCTFSLNYGIIQPEPVAERGQNWDVIIPVPNTLQPIWKQRGYCVPYWMAKQISCALDLPIQKDALRRTRKSKRQAGLKLTDRLANTMDTVTVTEQCDVKGKRVLLVDDVLTTGATVGACAEALLSAGAESVYAIALASSQWQNEIES